MNPPPTVYLDAMVLRFSQTSLLRFFPRKTTLDWGHTKSELVVNDLKHFNPNIKIRDLNHRREANLVEQIAHHVKAGKIQAVMQMETELESWNHVTLEFNEKGKFYGAPIKYVDAPFRYERTMIGGRLSIQELQLGFFSGIKDKRFIELQKITGAFQGNDKYCHQQLLDAFHIWCAEYNRCDYFLTLDYNLIKMVARHKLKPVKPVLVRPSQLLYELSSPLQKFFHRIFHPFASHQKTHI
ncbi:MAG TPA: hypothetical protein VGH42_13290 [Verrucomicrobiae bacterium]|jgi:hypothetical protein